MFTEFSVKDINWMQWNLHTHTLAHTTEFIGLFKEF